MEGQDVHIKKAEIRVRKAEFQGAAFVSKSKFADNAFKMNAPYIKMYKLQFSEMKIPIK